MGLDWVGLGWVGVPASFRHVSPASAAVGVPHSDAEIAADEASVVRFGSWYKVPLWDVVALNYRRCRKLERGTQLLFKTIEKIINHRASSRASSTNLPKQVYST